MNNNRRLELLVGLFLLAGLAALFALAMQVSNLGTAYTGGVFKVNAYFDNIGGLKTKAPVTMSGVEVGRVLSINYDVKRYQAHVVMGIQDKYLKHIPDDTFAKILTAGLLGEQYIGLDPGGSSTYLKNGSSITVTQSAMILENLIGQLIFGKGHGGSK